MNPHSNIQPNSPNRGVKFRIVPAFTAALCCAVLAFLTVQLIGFAIGLEFPIRTIAGIHFALATAIVAGFATVMFAMDDKDDREVIVLPTHRTPRPQHDLWRTTKRAA